MTPLEQIIRARIAAQGPLSLAAYMELALQHPEYGYYRVREPLGRDGDFITAPEVSQLFGESLGVWAAETWRALGSPAPFALVELGPGRGTLMEDLLRATARVPGFHDAMRLFLVESDKVLRAEQAAKLATFSPVHLDGIEDLPELPTLIVANEFFDALPVRQFEKTFQDWAERMVALDEAGALTTVLRPLAPEEMPMIPPGLREAVPGGVFEISPKAVGVMKALAAHLVARRGAMLAIDYGYAVPPLAATVQAVARHERADILERPGEVDLTAHVDFGMLAGAARAAGAEVSPVIGQGVLLRALGIELRAGMLRQRATAEQAAALDAALARLVNDDQMGVLFKAIEVKNYG